MTDVETVTVWVNGYRWGCLAGGVIVGIVWAIVAWVRSRPSRYRQEDHAPWG